MMREYKLLGTFEILEDGRPSALMKSKKGCALVAYLIVTGQSQSREVIADLLWESSSTGQALHSLRSLLSRIRRWVPELSITRHSVAFTPGSDTFVDLAVLPSTLVSDYSNLKQVDAALRLYRGDLLDNFYLDDAPRFSDWLVQVQQRVRLQVVAVHSRLCMAYVALGETAAAADIARRWLELDALDEEPLRQLMTLMAQQGRPDRALQQYESSRSLHLAKLKLDLQLETKNLAQRIRAGEFKSARTAPDVSSQRMRRFWDETPHVDSFFGRSAELEQLRRWFLDETCPVVAICGIGGVGKTSLAAKTVRTIGENFDTVVWRSLLNAPLLNELLPPLLQTVSKNSVPDMPGHVDDQLSLLLDLLRKDRCLLVLDNVETIMADDRAGAFRAGYSDYGRLLQFLSEQEHRSGLLITSREVPIAFNRLISAKPRVRIMNLTGLASDVGREMLQAHDLDLDEADANALIARYSGNPLALNLVAQTVQEFYSGDTASFLAAATPIFGDIRSVLDQQFQRLSSLEQEILLWFAIVRDALPVAKLQELLFPLIQQGRFLEALRTLQRRSLLEKTANGFALQNVVIEYLTASLIAWAVDELRSGQLNILKQVALQQAQARSYVRRVQSRLILQPIAEQLAADPGQTAFAAVCRKLLDHIRSENDLTANYAAGNLLNLLLHMGIDVTDYDFSRLSMWQANLQDAFLQRVSFAGADLSQTVFADTFGMIYAVDFSPNGRLLAAGAADGRVRIWDLTTGQPLTVFQGHIDAVWSLTFSPNGNTLATTSADRSVRLWDVTVTSASSTHQPTIAGARSEIVLHEYESGVQTAAFSPDGMLLATGSEDGIVTVWDTRAGTLHSRLRGHLGNVESVAFSPDGRYLASGSRDQTVRLWEMERVLNPDTSITSRTTTVHVLRGHSSWIHEVVFSADGKTLVSASEDGTMCCWSMLPGRGPFVVDGDESLANLFPSRILRQHDGGVQSVAFSPDGRTLASGSADQTIRLWDIATGQVVNILNGHMNWVRCVRFSPDGRTLASGSWDNTVRLWRTTDGQEQRLFRGYSNPVFSVAFSPDSRIVASGSADGRVHLWDAPPAIFSSNAALPENRGIRDTLTGHTAWAWQVVFSPDGRRLASGGMDHRVCIWDVLSGRLMHTLQGHDDGVQAIAFAPDGKTLATGSLDRNILLWDLEFGRIRTRLEGHTGWVLGLSFSMDGRFLVSTGADNSVRFWNLAEIDASIGSDATRILYTHDNGVQQVCISPDNRYIASGGWDRTVKIWDVAHAAVCHTLRGHTDIVRPVAFSPDGQTLLSGGNDRTIRLWHVDSGEQIHLLEGHEGAVFSAEFSPDGRFIVSASGDESIRLWDVQSGLCLWTQPMPKPYAGMNIVGVTGLTPAQRMILKELGAVG